MLAVFAPQDNLAVVSGHHLDGDGLATLHADDLSASCSGLPAVLGLVLQDPVGLAEPLHEEVLIVSLGVGDAPRNACVVPEVREPRTALERRARSRRNRRTRYVVLVVDVRRIEAAVGVARYQGLARPDPAAGNGPIVAPRIVVPKPVDGVQPSR